ncbi:MAG: hypothetical protein AM325_007795 [Candidatus Thorarchaeota archaeon SMTZ1-45]|nr:MAG: hypothetical protein AM325_09515 [Candidatus Thorarchaeota archaeon SMTZ1-45]
MAEMSLVTSEIETMGQPSDKLGKIAALGNIFGVIAAVFGLIIGKTLVPISALEYQVVSVSPFGWVFGGDSMYSIYIAVFMALMAISLLFQAIGSKNLRNFLGSGLMNIIWIGFVVAAAAAFLIPTSFLGVVAESLIQGFLTQTYFLGGFFVIAWQLLASIYTDASKTWIGFLAGTLNSLFIPLLAIGQAISPILIYAAYAILLIGQLFSFLFWQASFDSIREYARSTEKAKLAFTLSGALTFALGLTAIFFGPLGNERGIDVWKPWSTMANETTFQTSPALIFGLLSLMLYWVILAPRLGARELKAAAIGEDIIKGGTKWFLLFLASFGLLAAGQAGAFTEDAAVWGFFLSLTPAGIMFLVGAAYTAKTDIITGIPLVIASVFIIVHPFILLPLVIIPWIAVIITQFFLVAESLIRGLTGFSQGALTVVVSLVASAAVIIFMIGGFGSGPLALWPTNRWFNITLIPGIPAAVQGPAIIILPLLALLIRNVSLAGYSYGRGYATGGLLVGMSVFFAFMIPVIAENESIGHEANTGAALLLALYSISVVLVLSLNLSLANDVEDTGRRFEGTLIKVTSIAGILAAAAVVILALIVFAGMPTPEQIALMISIMVTFVVSTEIFSIINWLIAGIRLGMLREGFRFSRLE